MLKYWGVYIYIYIGITFIFKNSMLKKEKIKKKMKSLIIISPRKKLIKISRMSIQFLFNIHAYKILNSNNLKPLISG